MARGSFTPELNSPESEKEESRKPDNTAFKQQRLPAWQPILTAHSVLPAFFIISIIFIPIGVVLLLASNDVVEYQFDYTDCGDCARLRENPNAMMDPCTCVINITMDKDMTGDVFMYYGLSNYFQNHRRYVKSRDDNQLVGNTGDVSSECSPFDKVNGSIPIAPCGAIANSLFNDTFILEKDGSVISFQNTGIAWSTDKNQKFNNPAGQNLSVAFGAYAKPKFWQKRVEQLDSDNPDNNGYENEAFIVWMRTAAFPTFRKLYGRLNRTAHQNGLSKGEYKMIVTYNYPVTSFDGSKRIILSTTSWIGGKNSFLGIGYLVVGSLCFAIGVALCVVHQLTKKSNVTP